MVISTNSTPESTAFSTEIKHNDPTHAVSNANISLNNNALDNNISSPIPPELTVLRPEIIEYELINYNQDNRLQNKKNAYFSAIESVLNGIKNGNREIENGKQNIINGRIDKDPALMKERRSIIRKRKEAKR